MVEKVISTQYLENYCALALMYTGLFCCQKKSLISFNKIVLMVLSRAEEVNLFKVH